MIVEMTRPFPLNKMSASTTNPRIYSQNGGGVRSGFFPDAVIVPQGKWPAPLNSPGTSISLGWRNHDEVRDRRPVRVGHETCI